MGPSAFLSLEVGDIAAFVIASFIGYFAGTLMPFGSWSLYTSLLISYHLFLAWLVAGGTRRFRVSHSVGMTLLGHLACVVAVVGVAAMARFRVNGFWLLRYALVLPAVLERGWLFRLSEVQAGPVAGKTAHRAAIASSADDAAEWQRYLEQRPAFARKPGVSMRAEYEKWVARRHKKLRRAAGQPSPR